MNGLTPKSVLVDKLRPELGAKLMRLLKEDTDRAQAEKTKRAGRQRAADAAPEQE